MYTKMHRIGAIYNKDTVRKGIVDSPKNRKENQNEKRNFIEPKAETN